MCSFCLHPVGTKVRLLCVIVVIIIIIIVIIISCVAFHSFWPFLVTLYIFLSLSFIVFASLCWGFVTNFRVEDK